MLVFATMSLVPAGVTSTPKPGQALSHRQYLVGFGFKPMTTASVSLTALFFMGPRLSDTQCRPASFLRQFHSLKFIGTSIKSVTIKNYNE
jgi:hypothetical protein